MHRCEHPEDTTEHAHSSNTSYGGPGRVHVGRGWHKVTVSLLYAVLVGCAGYVLPKGSYVFATATFASLDIAAFGDAQFNASFRTGYKNNVAAAAVRAAVFVGWCSVRALEREASIGAQGCFRAARGVAVGNGCHCTNGCRPHDQESALRRGLRRV